MPLKDPAANREYMRNYMRRRYELKRNAQKPIAGDFDPSTGKQTLDISKAGDIINKTKEIFSKDTAANPDADNDPVLKFINRYGKYLPVVMQFFKGFQASYKDYKANQAQEQVQKIQAPTGWLEMTPMQKLGYKYSRSEWYAAGEAYDQFVENGSINPAININHVDPNYTPPARRQEPQNMQQLAKKYPEPPLVNDPAPSQQKSDSTPAAAEQQAAEAPQTEAILEQLQKDNAKYLKMGLDYVNNLSMASFKNYINSIDVLIQQAKGMKDLLPIHVRSMIINTPSNEIEDIFKNGCSEKYAWLKKARKIKKLLELFEALKEELKK